jgi:hypothetical protein
MQLKERRVFESVTFYEGSFEMKKMAGFVSAVALALMMFAPSKASAQQVNIYVGHGQG